MSDQPSDYEHPIEYIDEKYEIDSEDKQDSVVYRPEGAEAVELVYKMYLAEARRNDDDFDTGWDIEIMTLSRIYNSIVDDKHETEDYRQELNQDYDEVPEEGHRAVNTMFRLKVADSVLLYYTLANEVVQGMAAEILREELFESRQANPEDLLSGLTHSQLANLLYHSGVIDKKLKDEIINANKTRNRLVHEFGSRHYLEGVSEVLSMIDRVNSLLDEMHDILYSRRPFS